MSTDLWTAPGDPAVRPVTADERAARAAANGGEPTVEFDANVPYDAYVQARVLHTLQRPISGDPGEMSFLMVSQIMELYFGLTRYELIEAGRLIDRDDVWGALAPLRRAALHLRGLTAAWQTLSWMTPADFNRFRDLLGEGSGFQSAMYRQLEFALGLKSAALVRAYRRQPEAYAELTAALHQPSLWDRVLALLARCGHDLPTELLDRDVAADHQPHEAVERAWVEIYSDAGPDNRLRLLGEALTDVADQFGDWRYQHLKTVQRTMGAKVGSGGSAGVTWLQRSMARVVFPELWSARTFM